MEQAKNLYLIDHPASSLETAIPLWLAARTACTKLPSDENLYAYNATYFALGEAWAKRYPEAADEPGAFDLFRNGLTAAEHDSQSKPSSSAQ